MQEVKLSSERQDVRLAWWKSGLQSKATEKSHETIFEEMREKKSEEALVLLQKSTFCHDVKVKGKERECCKDWEDRER